MSETTMEDRACQDVFMVKNTFVQLAGMKAPDAGTRSVMTFTQREIS
jgi:hypothetical protein